MAGSNIIEVDIDALKKDVTNINDKIKEINTDMDKMFTEILALSGMWKGKASETFRKQFETDKLAFEDLISDLNKIAEHFDDSAKQYIQCEKDVAAEVNSIKIG